MKNVIIILSIIISAVSCIAVITMYNHMETLNTQIEVLSAENVTLATDNEILATENETLDAENKSLVTNVENLNNQLKTLNNDYSDLYTRYEQMNIKYYYTMRELLCLEFNAYRYELKYPAEYDWNIGNSINYNLSIILGISNFCYDESSKCWLYQSWADMPTWENVDTNYCSADDVVINYDGNFYDWESFLYKLRPIIIGNYNDIDNVDEYLQNGFDWLFNNYEWIEG